MSGKCVSECNIFERYGGVGRNVSESYELNPDDIGFSFFVYNAVSMLYCMILQKVMTFVLIQSHDWRTDTS